MDLDNLRIRKPARRISEIPPSVLDALSAGQLQTRNLVEWLATSRERLLEVICTQFGLVNLHHSAEIWTDKLLGESALKQSFAIGQWWLEHCKVGDAVWCQLSTHESDIVREWAAIVVGRSSDLSFARKLAWIKPFADDEHSGLREIAWLALRPDVSRDPVGAVRCLVPWTGSRHERLRRFASEITRPCGVWTSHIAALKDQPELGLPILQPLMSDTSKYVKDSVGNWLNDASKSKPDWVRALIDTWLAKSDTPDTAYIAKRALRSLNKASGSMRTTLGTGC